MDWSAENRKDAKLLDRIGLAALDPGIAAGDGDLVAMVEGHNDRAALAIARFRILAADRQNFADFNHGQARSSTELMAEHARLRSEAWEVLRELRHVLEERDDVLGQIEQRLLEQYQDAGREHHQAVTAAERHLSRQRRVLEKANPSTANAHFAELVAGEESVGQAARQWDQVRRALENMASARRSIVAALSAITVRQREVFMALVN